MNPLALTFRRFSIAQLLLAALMVLLTCAAMAIYLASDILTQRSIDELAAKQARKTSQLIFQSLYGVMQKGWIKHDIQDVVTRIHYTLPEIDIHLVRNKKLAEMFGESEYSLEQREHSAQVNQVMESGQELLRAEADRLHFIYPLVADEGCIKCHTNVQEGYVNGVIHITFPLKELKVPLSFALTNIIHIFGVITLLILLIQFFVFRRFFVQPIMNLTEHILTIRETRELPSQKTLRDSPTWFRELHHLTENFCDLMQNLNSAQNRLRDQSERDELTGLFNRRFFNRTFAAELSRAKRYKHSVALFMLDLNGFKPINDTYGHGAGDAILQALGREMQNKLRDNDIIARVGGDEFVVLAPEIGSQGASQFEEKLRSLIEQTTIVYEGEQLSVGTSIGVALYPDHGDEAKQLLDFADEAMYADKRRRKGLA
ncbi:diguanylate cyclase [Magnetococcus marinus MC-1]|uniref:Diguanylate cyclase n=1 Tax=Magnetococcus marinus (strain ATCC BAA-1437 / JCM 17883 / MC-1) TaxID=156889 RepID=A0LC10_MAGMM|nr:GGDEF domain-containing protein [Magnetococcus marinus]ABK45503.1 diguanylate cyclase [Magnetococcus marinus MC-1]